MHRKSHRKLLDMKVIIRLLAGLCISIPLLYIGWERWLAAKPQPLPTRSIVSDGKNYGFPQGRYYEVSIPFTSTTTNKRSADYRLWIPDGVKTVRGLIVKQHGCGDPTAATGLDHANDLQWQTLTLKHQFAILGTKLPTGNPLCTDEAIAARAAEDSFLTALRNLAETSRHPELETVPWALWGHSGGADWAMQMLRHYPARVIAVANMRSGGIRGSSRKSEILDLDPKSVSALLEVPVLWSIGAKDPNVDECIILPQKIFSKFRAAGAKWTLAIAAKTGHESGDTRFLAIPYLDTMISTRLTSDGHPLRSIASTQGWLGNNVTHTVAPIASYRDNPAIATWIPTEAVAHKWQQYVNTGKISPTRKPASPTNLSATKIGAKEVLIAWSFIPDLEDGLPSFRIYRDNSLIVTLTGQSHNFGDAPDPKHVALEFVDKGASVDSSYVVAAFNVLGESMSPSKPLGAKK
jgi:hypothetical protein